MYDFLIVGAGLAGCTFAYLANKAGYKCIVFEKKNEIGGMCATENVNGIHVHKYGAHIFKTSDKKVWDFVTGISDFSPFVNSPKARYLDRLFSLPINMNTFHEMWGVITPDEAAKIISEQKVHFDKIENIEQFVLSEVGTDIYRYLIKDYTEKQWGRSCTEISPEVMRRIPIRLTYNNNYYDSIYQGIPEIGYSDFMHRMLDGIEVHYNVDYVALKERYNRLAKCVVYTGALDDLFSFEFGQLEYRSLIFEHKIIPEIDNFQGVAVVNQTSVDVPYTRVIEHKHFMRNMLSRGTVISYETPCKYVSGDDLDRYYPINDAKNTEKYNKYKSMIPSNMFMLGRLAEYRYIDMAETVRSAMNLFDKLHN